MKMHHIGICVKNIEKAQKKYEDLGYRIASKEKVGNQSVQDDYERNIRILFMENGIDDVMVELIQLLDESKPSAVDFINKGKAGNYSDAIPYHICYEVEDIDLATEELRKKRFIVINSKQPTTEVLNNKCVTFMFNRSAGIIELIEKEKK